MSCIYAIISIAIFQDDPDLIKKALDYVQLYVYMFNIDPFMSLSTIFQSDMSRQKI